ncbi:MAG: type II secretion system protein GspG [Verrucomicrobiota bacterium]
MKLLTTLPHPRRSRNAFTLMELLLVLAIIGLLMGGGAAVYSGIMDGAKRTKTQSKIGTIAMQLQQYQAQKSGRLPSQSVGLNALKQMGAVKTDEELLDSWGEPLIYNIPPKRGGDGFDLWSKGPDKLENTGDDVGNWITP